MKKTTCDSNSKDFKGIFDKLSRFKKDKKTATQA